MNSDGSLVTLTCQCSNNAGDNNDSNNNNNSNAADMAKARLSLWVEDKG